MFISVQTISRGPAGCFIAELALLSPSRSRIWTYRLKLVLTELLCVVTPREAEPDLVQGFTSAKRPPSHRQHDRQ